MECLLMEEKSGEDKISELSEVNALQAISQKKNIFTRLLYSKKPVLPVGFRSGVLWKMIVAVYGYAGILWLSITMELDTKTIKTLYEVV